MLLLANGVPARTVAERRHDEADPPPPGLARDAADLVDQGRGGRPAGIAGMRRVGVSGLTAAAAPIDAVGSPSRVAQSRAVGASSTRAPKSTECLLRTRGLLSGSPPSRADKPAGASPRSAGGVSRSRRLPHLLSDSARRRRRAEVPHPRRGVRAGVSPHNHGERVVKVFLYERRRGFVWEDARVRRGGGQQEWYRTLRGSDDRRSPRLMSTLLDMVQTL